MPGGGERRRESDFPDFPFSGQKVASIPFRRSFVRSFVRFVVSQLLQNCIIHLTFERRARARATDDMCGRAKTRIALGERRMDMSLWEIKTKVYQSRIDPNNHTILKQPMIKESTANFLDLARRNPGPMHLIMRPKGRDR